MTTPESQKQTKTSDEVRKEMYDRLAAGATLQAVGDEYGVTRERIRQHMVKGAKKGLFVYPFPEKTPPDLETALAVYRKERNLPRTAKHFDMSESSLRAWLAAQGVTDADLKTAVREGRKDEAFDQYMEIVTRLGQHPSTTLMQRDYNNLYALICRLWGNFTAFRETLDIPAPPPGNPNFREDMVAGMALRSARIRREALERILATLNERGPQTFNELKPAVSVGETLLREILANACEEGSVARIGTGAGTMYRATGSEIERQRPTSDAPQQGRTTTPSRRLRKKYSTLVVRDVPVEANYAERSRRAKPLREIIAERREARLVQAFKRHLEERWRLRPIGKQIEVPGKRRPLLVDLFEPAHNLLVEAKGVTSREKIRMAIGQLADYRRFLDRPTSAILLPVRPSRDLLDLARTERIEVIWQTEAGFEMTLDLAEPDRKIPA
jgi:hypothetical protein